MSAYIVVVKRPCVCTEADDPNDHRKDCPHWYGHDGVTRRAIATLDEARQDARNAVEHRAQAPGWTPEYVAAREAARAIAESGGTVGPLPDGTLIEVKPTTWAELAVGQGWGRPANDDWVSAGQRATLLAAYNEAQGGGGMSATNETAALRISRAAGVISAQESDPEAILRDLLSDARHFADREGLDFAAADRMAYTHYLDELAAERELYAQRLEEAGHLVEAYQLRHSHEQELLDRRSEPDPQRGAPE